MEMDVGALSKKKETLQSETLKIDKKFVHKDLEQNVFISDIRQNKDVGDNIFECFMVVDQNVPFFFEHYIDHLPGLLLVEGARQMGTAITHKFYGVDFDNFFIIDHISAEFKNMIEIDKDILLRTTLEDRNRKTFSGSLEAIQNNNIVAMVRSSWTCIPKKTWTRIRSKKI